MKILYVEDNQYDAELTARYLSKNAPDIQLDITSTQPKAEALLAQNNYDLILIDLNLPQGDGMSLMTNIQNQDYPAALVIITGHGDQESAIAALHAGAEDYILKTGDYLTSLPKVLEDAYTRYQNKTSKKARPVRVLYAEDNPDDIERTILHLKRYAPHILVKTTGLGASVPKLLEKGTKDTFDVLLIDYRLPDMNALELLKELWRRQLSDIPIVLTASYGDEQVALQAIKLGASDFLVKTAGYLHRLPATIENVLFRARLIKEENRYRSLFEDVPVGIFRATQTGDLLEANPAMLKILGLEQITPDTPTNLFRHFADLNLTAKTQERLFSQNKVFNIISHLKQKDDNIAWVDLDIRPIQDRHGHILHLEGTVKDITERALAEQAHQNLEQERYLEQAILLQLAQSLLSTNDIHSIMDMAVQESAQGLSATYAALALVDQEERTFSVLAETGYPSPVGQLLKNVPLDRGTEISYVIANNTPAIIHTPRPETPYQRSPHVEKFGIQSSLVVPMSVSGRRIGAMIAESDTQRSWKDNEVRLLTLLASATEQALQRAQFFQQVQQARVRLSNLSKRLVEVQESERHTLARELHDQVGQTLTALKLHIQLTGNAPQAAPLHEDFQQSLQLIEGAIRQVRDLSRNLRPSILDDFGLEPALRWHLDNQAQLAGFSWDFDYNLDGKRLPEEIETVCYRVAQVALTNVVNHAQASHVKLSIWRQANSILMDICDDGQGFNVQQALLDASHGKTLGLLSMVERTELLGGKIKIDSQPGSGTCVHLKLPLDLGSPVDDITSTRTSS